MKSHFFIQNLVKFRALRGRAKAAGRAQYLFPFTSFLGKGKKVLRAAGRHHIVIIRGTRIITMWWDGQGENAAENGAGKPKEGVEKTIGVCPPYPPAAAASAAGGQRLRPFGAAASSGRRHQGRQGHQATGGGLLHPVPAADRHGNRRQQGTRGGRAAWHRATGGGLLHPIPAAGDRQQGRQGHQGRRIDTATDGSRAAGAAGRQGQQLSAIARGYITKIQER